MKKCWAISVVVLMCSLLTSCRNRESYSFLNSTDQISEIAIVALSFGEDEEMMQTEVEQISDIPAFLDEFNNMDCYMYYGDPAGVTEEGVEDTVFKITYANSEYELINWSGQAKYTLKNGLRYYAGYHVFEESQFETLIEIYEIGGSSS